MTCAKQQVICRIETTDGHVVTGENYCRNPQPVCPRDTQGYQTGEGYHLCREICQQVGHAEEVAVMNLRGRTGLQAELEGHSYACEPCKEALRVAGVQILRIVGEAKTL